MSSTSTYVTYSSSLPSMTLEEKKHRNRLMAKVKSLGDKIVQLQNATNKLKIVIKNDNNSYSVRKKYLKKYNKEWRKIKRLHKKLDKAAIKVDRFDSKRRRKLVLKLRKSKTPTRSRSSSRRRRRKKRTSRARRVTRSERLFS